MKKLLFLLPLMALVFFSCSKTEQQATPTMPQTDSVKPLMLPPLQTTLCIFWWCGDPLADTCWNYVTSDSICWIVFGCETEADIIANLSIDDNTGRLTEARIDKTDLVSAGFWTAFNKYINQGFISIAHDSPIDDEALLDVLTLDYLPAGNYPISLVNNTTVVINLLGNGGGVPFTE